MFKSFCYFYRIFNLFLTPATGCKPFMALIMLTSYTGKSIPDLYYFFRTCYFQRHKSTKISIFYRQADFP